ncbi:MAG: hypothetical protein U1D55_03675 [Phycisphaerae bacterium]
MTSKGLEHSRAATTRLQTLGRHSDHPPVSERTASGFQWWPQERRENALLSNYAGQIAEATPVNADLLEWAARPENQPSQSWWDETGSPFDASE